MIIIINEKGFMKHDEELVIDKDYMLIDGTAGGGQGLYRYRGVKVEDGLQMPDMLEEEDVSAEKKDRSFERHINSKAFKQGVLSMLAHQCDIDTLDKNFFLVFHDDVFEEYGEAIYDAFIEAVGLENEPDAPYLLLYKNFKKKDKDSEAKEYFEEYFMKWIRRDIKGSTLKALKKVLKEEYNRSKGEYDEEDGKSYKERLEKKKNKKHKYKIDDLDDDSIKTISAKDDKDKKKKKKDKKKKKKDKFGCDEDTLKDIKKEMKRISKQITLK